MSSEKGPSTCGKDTNQDAGYPVKRLKIVPKLSKPAKQYKKAGSRLLLVDIGPESFFEVEFQFLFMCCGFTKSLT